jgi:hypothetical protein
MYSVVLDKTRFGGHWSLFASTHTPDGIHGTAAMLILKLIDTCALLSQTSDVEYVL